MKSQMIKKSPGARRREAIMEAGLALFVERGYTEVSVDEIIKRSGGSKSSLYDFFGSKEGLLLELVSSVTNAVLSEVRPPDIADQPPAEALRRIGMAIGSEILTERAIRLYRLAVSQSAALPEFGRLFYAQGPEKPKVALAEYLRKETEAGRLKTKNPRRAAEFFFGMILVYDHISMSLGCSGPPKKAELKEIVDDAVEVFMSAYGRKAKA